MQNSVRSSCGAATIVFGLLAAFDRIGEHVESLEGIGIKVVPHTALAYGIAMLTALPAFAYSIIAVVSLLGWIFLAPRIQERIHRKRLAIPAGGITELIAEPFRINFDHVTVDKGSNGNPLVLVILTVTNLGEPRSIKNWQMLYWHNGKQRAAGLQPLQDTGWCVTEHCPEINLVGRWGFDEQIEVVTAKVLAKGETTSKVFCFAELCDSAGATTAELRGIHLQYQSGDETFKSDRIGGFLHYGALRLTNE